MTTQTKQIDETKAEAFVGKALGDVSGTFTYMLAMIGDRLGLFKTLADGPATSEELAQRADISERYAREWLEGLAAAEYLEYDPETARYTLPPEHEPVLTEEAGPVFFGGVYEQLAAGMTLIDDVAEAFRTGKGVPSSAYPAHWWTGMERFTSGWFENLLIPVWIPEMPIVEQKLEEGADVADVGCGKGRALIKLAETYPKSRYVGYDVLGPTVEQATRAAEEAGVADRVRFEQRDVSKGLDDSYDVVFTFDVVHDAVDPADMLKSIRRGLRPGGRYVCVDIDGSHKPEENVGPLAVLFYGFSVLYCMTTSLAHGGTGLGTLGFNAHVAEDMAREAGFNEFRTLPLDNPFNNVYEIS